MSKWPLVTIGITANDKSILDTINSVLFQNYPNIELILSFNQTSDVPICSVFDCINSNAGDNISSIKINYSKKSLTIEEHRDYFWENAIGEYFLFLKDYEAFYTGESLGLLLSDLSLDSDCVVGNTVVYSETDEYESVTDILHELLDRRGTIANLESKYICAYRRNVDILAEDVKYSVCDKPIKKSRKASLSFRQNVVKLEDGELFVNGRRYAYANIVMNYTDSNKLLQFIRRAQEVQNFDYGEICGQIEQEISYIIGKQRNGYWDVTHSDVLYIVFLIKLVERIQTIKSRRKKLLLYRVAISKYLSKKVNIVFFAQEYSTWPSMRPLYEAACKDSRYHVELVFVPFNHYNGDNNAEEELKLYRDAGYNICNYSDYDLCTSSPDVAIFVKPYDYVPAGFYIGDIDKVVRRCIYIQYGVTIESEDRGIIRLRYKLPMQYLAWHVLAADNWDYEMAHKYAYSRAENYWNVGLPRYDGLLKESKREYLGAVEKIEEVAKGRPIFLWNTHHSIEEGGMFGTWLKYGNAIVNYFEKHPSLFLVWRPHPLFFGALDRVMGFDSAARAEFWNRIDAIENIYIDKSPVYIPSIIMSDALISDMSSLVKEYLLLNKPILLALKTENSMPNKALYSVLYHLENDEDLDTFCKMIRDKKDVKKEMRTQYLYDNYNVGKKRTVSQVVLEKIAVEIRTEIRGNM